MRTGPLTTFIRKLRNVPPVSRVEGGMAKQWIKRRLLAVFPELRNHPDDLEAAYQELDMEPRRGEHTGDPYIYFDLKLRK